MSFIIAIGRILFALFFIISGAFTLADIPAAGKELSSRVSIPAPVAPYMTQIENAVGVSTPQLLAIVAGTVAVVCGLMIAFNLGVRFFSLLLIIGNIIATFYMDDIITTSGNEWRDNAAHALKNLSMIGALLVLFGHGSGKRIEQEPYHDR
jgi:uncharacterized membrane protein YphA (DoxX/SURF4 family)